MLCKRIIPCLDVDGGRTVKGVRFGALRDAGDPAAQAVEYMRQGADEIVLLDISASAQGRATTLETVERAAEGLAIPLTVGGGVSCLRDVRRLLERGADKVSVNSAAVARPALISEIAEVCGSQCCVLAVDARRRGDGWEVLTHGGRRSSGLDALAWAREGARRGAGEVLLTSWDKDGTREGFDLELTALVCAGLPVPVIASGGAAGPGCFARVFAEAGADAALAAGIFHDGAWTVGALKRELKGKGVEVRL